MRNRSWILKKMLGNPNVTFLEEPAASLTPPDLELSPDFIARWKAELDAANDVPLPDDDDDL